MPVILFAPGSTIADYVKFVGPLATTALGYLFWPGPGSPQLVVDAGLESAQLRCHTRRMLQNTQILFNGTLIFLVLLPAANGRWEAAGVMLVLALIVGAGGNAVIWLLKRRGGGSVGRPTPGHHWLRTFDAEWKPSRSAGGEHQWNPLQNQSDLSDPAVRTSLGLRLDYRDDQLH